MYEVVSIRVQWNGADLEVRPVFGKGWSMLTGYREPIGRRQTMSCGSIHDLTNFQLEAAIYSAMTTIGNLWDDAQKEQGPAGTRHLTPVDDSPSPF